MVSTFESVVEHDAVVVVHVWRWDYVEFKMVEFNTYFSDLAMWLVVAVVVVVMAVSGCDSRFLLGWKFGGLVTHVCQVVACLRIFCFFLCIRELLVGENRRSK